MLPLPTPAITMPFAPAAAAALIRAPSMFSVAMMMSTRGRTVFLSTENSEAEVFLPTGPRYHSTSPYATVPIRPETGERNVCTAVVLVLVSEEAPWIQSLTTTSTPRPAASLFAATATALKKLSGPSAERAVDGRIDAVITTGFLDLITRFRT